MRNRGCHAKPALVALGLVLAGGCAAFARAGPPDARGAEISREACGPLPQSRPLVYRNRLFGLTMTYPSSFALDPDSIPASGDSARFWTPDRQATAVVTGLRNGLRQSLADLFAEARRDVTENSGGPITYMRTKDNWFVVSGFMAGRIFYRRTLLKPDGTAIGHLSIEFPRGMRPCFEDAVTMMSLSFRSAGPD